MNRLRDENGQTLIIVAIGITMILGFVAFATDVGIQLRNRRLAQTAADAAAVAGAAQLLNANPSSTIVNAAGEAAMTQNGFPTTAVTMTWPYNGSAWEVGATVQQSSSTIFMGLFGHSSLTVAASAVAGLGQGNICIYALNTGSGVSVNGSNNGKIDVPGCGVQDNSTYISVVGSANITSKYIGVVGTAGQNSDSISNGGTTTPNPTYGVAPVGDPLASMTTPNYSTSGCTTALSLNQWSGPLYGTLSASTVSTNGSGYACYGNVDMNGGNDTLYNPGVFIVNGNLTSENGATANFGCGFYYITGNLTLQNNADNGGSSTCGVTFFVEGNINIANGPVVKFIAPTSGTYNGMLFWQASKSGATISLAGGANSLLEGVIYSSQGTLSLSNGTNTSIYSDLVVGSVSFVGGENFYSYQSLPGTTNPIKAVKLVQ